MLAACSEHHASKLTARERDTRLYLEPCFERSCMADWVWARRPFASKLVLHDSMRQMKFEAVDAALLARLDLENETITGGLAYRASELLNHDSMRQLIWRS
jgi:hypothetical protein